MNKLFNSIFIFVIAFFSAGIIWLIVLLTFLEKTPVLYTPTAKIFHFYSINLTHLFFPYVHKKKKIEKKIETLKGVKLKAIYNDGKNGFVILEDKTTHFVNLGEYYKGYRLNKILQTKVILTKNNKNYILELFNAKKPVTHKKKKKYDNIQDPNKYKKPVLTKIPKSQFLAYRFNLFVVWNNIGIVKTKQGYKITYIRKDSIFDKMGLKIGDILVSINGRKLTNDKEAWQLYKQSKKFDYFQVVIKRNNKRKVLNYEIN